MKKGILKFDSVFAALGAPLADIIHGPATAFAAKDLDRLLDPIIASKDYPLGGMIEPYDIAREGELLDHPAWDESDERVEFERRDGDQG